MLTQADVSGPSVDWGEDSIVGAGDLASFRMLAAYVPQQDEIKLRMDIKVGALQHGRTSTMGFPASMPGQRITPCDPLIKPSSGVVEAMAVQVPRLKLAEIFRDFAEKLEGMR